MDQIEVHRNVINFVKFEIEHYNNYNQHVMVNVAGNGEAVNGGIFRHSSGSSIFFLIAVYI